MKQQRNGLLALALASAIGLTACSGKDDSATPGASMTETSGNVNPTTEQESPASFREFLEEAYAADMERYPLTATYRGIKTNNDKWNPVSEPFQQETRELNQARLQQLGQFDRERLSPSEQLSYDLYKLNLERQLSSDEFRHHHYVIHQFRGPHTAVPSALINIHRIADRQDAEDYIGRLRNVARYFDQVISQMAIRTEKGLLLADWQYPKMLESAQNVIAGAPYDDSDTDSTLWEDFKAKVAALDIDDQMRQALLDEAETVLVNVVKPAYQRLIAAIAQQAQAASEDDGVWKFPEGDAFYAQRLRWFTTTDLSADEIHSIGLSEVERIHDEMRSIMQKVGFEGDLPAFFDFMREDEQFYYPNTDAGREAYLTEARAAIDAMRERLPDYFGLLPEAELVVKRVEAFRERSAGKAFYQAPPKDGSRPGIYYANLYDMADMPKYQLEALAFHEGVPGHHMQRAITVMLDDIPEFQKYASFTAFTEGWGLYTEELAKDMGFYEDPYSDFGRLAMELWRACRLVVDTGIHSKRWTREEAIDYLVENTPNSLGDSTRAIERYIAMPGQATAYLIGKLKIMEMREKARVALGEDFDIRDFHDEVLKDGPVPLSILEKKVDAMIERQAG
ncbi:DUF885 domain-containing protein [Chromatocurvus halotolerans]|uniref:DUF885 domain-containing protein n=1 Tax=Chromatocurvus halotolerans TaxID=1132028 RepID=UPI001F0B79D4|nr:DUF885 domain-containing protein [Chromatocurvus halotolerans]